MKQILTLFLLACLFIILTPVSEGTVPTPFPTYRGVDFKDPPVIPLASSSPSPSPSEQASPSLSPKPIPSPKVVLKPAPTPKPTPKPIVLPKPSYHPISGFIYDSEVSWYGPGFYGHRTACGYALTTTILGVANRTLPCGTLVTFKWKNVEITVPVIDRGPYVAGRQWDLTGGLCTALSHCFTGPIYYLIH